jgi:Avidin family
MESKADLKLFSQVNAQAFDLVGTWVNELGSTMKVDSVKNGVISGSYKSKVSQNGASVGGSLTGMLTGDTIGFCVNWSPKFDSVTSWSGKILSTQTGTPFIYTLWQLSQGVDAPEDWWQSFLAGSDTFWRTA